MRGRRVAYLGLFCAVAILLGYVESLIPPLTAVPGIKLGLPNLAVVTVLYLYSWREALLVSGVRVAVVALLFGNLFSFWFSLAGGLLSLLAMALLKKTGWLDCVGVSLAGGLAHNAGQIAVAALVVENLGVAYYFIPLALSGLVTGVAVGLVSGLLIRRLAAAAPDLGDGSGGPRRRSKEKEKGD